jgi:serine/threonine-protein kinase RsbW
MTPVSCAFPKRLDALPQIFTFLEQTLVPLNADDRARHDLAFAVEEFFTNMVKYTPESVHDVVIRIGTEADQVEVILENSDVEPFDVTRAVPTDTTLPLEQRRPGGLGIQISREILDQVRYRYENRTSIITLVRKLRE